MTSPIPKLLTATLLAVTIQLAIGPRPVFAGEAAPSRGSAYAYYLQALNDRVAGRLADSLAALEKALAADPSSVTLLLEASQTSIRLGDMEQARKWAEKAVTLEPDRAAAQIVLARIYAVENQVAKAMKVLEDILRTNPGDAEALLLMGTLYAQAKDYQRAIDSLEQATRQAEGGSFMAHYYLGRLYRDAGKADQAERHFLDAIGLNPHLGTVYVDLADLYVAKGATDKAISTYQSLLTNEPMNLQAREQLARLLIVEDRLAEALEELRYLRQVASDDPHLGLKIAVLCLQLKRHDEALEVLQDLTESHPDDAQIQFYTALAYEQKGDFSRATDILRAIPLDNDVAEEAVIRLAHILATHGQLNEAITELENALEARPDTPEWEVALASLYQEEGRFSEAEDLLNQALALKPDDPAILFQLAMVLDRRGDRKEAIRLMEGLLQKDPENVLALNYLGYTYAEEGIRLDEAEALVQKALAKRPDDGFITDSLGWVYYKKGLLEKATTWLEKARELASQDPIIAEHLGDVYRARRLLYRALKTYRSAVDLATSAEDRARLRQKVQDVQDAISDQIEP